MRFTCPLFRNFQALLFPRRAVLMATSLVWNTLALQGQVTLWVDSVPAYTPSGAAIYVAGTFNSWNPGSSTHLLTLRPDSTRWITLPAGTGPIQFKFTRGSWTSVEGNSSGGFRPNRTHTYGNGDTLRLQIASWEDLHGGGGGGGGGTANAQVRVMTDSFWMPTLGKYRRIRLYLPTDYQTALHKRYPVLYMHDGQNLFDAATSFAGEWEVDECLTRLQQQGDFGAIVVGIDHGGSQRIAEYSPWVHPQYGGGQGDAYLQFIVQTLKPYMDSLYRTDSTRQGTWLWGSSMGGLISQYGAVKYQEVFSKVGVFSPSLWFDSRIFQQPVQEGYRFPVRFYLLAGALESSSMVGHLQQMRDQLLLAGFPSSDIASVVRADGQHSEWFWRREFQEAYRWLQGNQAATVDFGTSNRSGLKGNYILPNPCQSGCAVVLDNGRTLTQEDFLGHPDNSLDLMDSMGRLLKRATPKDLDWESVWEVPEGMYTIRLRLGGRSYVLKLNKI
jgi:metallo-beta-lactamase class B